MGLEYSHEVKKGAGGLTAVSRQRRRAKFHGSRMLQRIMIIPPLFVALTVVFIHGNFTADVSHNTSGPVRMDRRLPERVNSIVSVLGMMVIQ